ncbi:MAG: hypothetical protein ACK5HT_22530, partial [Draconibacterium sp.]
MVRSKCKKCGGIIVINPELEKPSENTPDPGNTPETEKLKEEREKETVENNTETKIPEKIAIVRNKIQKYFKNEAGKIRGFKKLVYVFLKVFCAYIIGASVGQIFGLVIPFPWTSFIAIYIIILLLNWKNILSLVRSTVKPVVLFKDKWKSFSLPLILTTIVMFPYCLNY